MTDTPTARLSALEWLQSGTDDPTDLRSRLHNKHRVDMAVRMESTIPHATDEQRQTFFSAAVKAQPHMLRAGPTSPDVEREALEKMTAPERLAKANKDAAAK